MNAFDKFASAISTQISHAWFFAFCCLTVLVWVPSYFLIGNLDTWQLIINTYTTVITFLMVALLQNAQQQFENSVQEKLDQVLEAVGRSEAAGIEKEMGT